jgi:hypothetical protein
VSRSAEIVVLVPVLDRPHRALPLAVSVRDSSDARVMFLCTPGDKAEIKACSKARKRVSNVEVVEVPFELGPGDYARKVNLGVLITDEPWLFQGADDLIFHSGWAEEALHTAARTGRRVIGTNDMGNRRVKAGRHSTHSLVARSYIEEIGTVDEPGKMLHEGYFHNFCDDELIQAATRRREFAMALSAKVEHLHWRWPTLAGTPKAERDATYDRAEAEFHEDRMRYNRRRKFWGTARPHNVPPPAVIY